MKNLLVLTAAVCALPAFAQDTTVPYQAAVRAGIQFPVNTDLGSGAFFNIGLDYTFDRSLFSSGQTYLAVDLFAKNTKFDSNQIYTGLLSQRFMFGTSADQMTRTYGFVGLGLGIIDVNESSTVFAGRLGLGAEFTSQLFAEVSLSLTSRARKTDIQGNFIGINLGYRF